MVNVGHQLRAVFYGLRHRRLSLGADVRFLGPLIVRGPGRVTLGDGCLVGSPGGLPTLIQTFSPEAVVAIGERSQLNGPRIAAQEEVRIGNFCILGPEAQVMDTDFHNVWPSVRHAPQVTAEKVHLEDNVWLATRAAALKGTHVGRNTVVGYNTVVRGDVPADSVVVGAPNRVVYTFGV